ncbi:MAG: hypothetical protein ACPG4N_01965 [Gammaproteobacteria bacterium]
MSNRELIVGLKGLRDPSWGEEFFPDDLPEDWRFSFVTNEVRALLLDEDDVSVIPEDFEDWSDEIEEGFHLLHTPHSILRDMGEYLKSEGGEPLELEGLASCWATDQAVPGARVALIHLDDEPSPATLRAWVEAFMADSPDEPTLFMIFDGPPAAKAVREARVLVELMGF